MSTIDWEEEALRSENERLRSALGRYRADPPRGYRPVDASAELTLMCESCGAVVVEGAVTMHMTSHGR